MVSKSKKALVVIVAVSMIFADISPIFAKPRKRVRHTSYTTRSSEMRILTPEMDGHDVGQSQLQTMEPMYQPREARTISDSKMYKNRSNRWLTREDVIQLLYPNGGYEPLRHPDTRSDRSDSQKLIQSHTISNTAVGNQWRPSKKASQSKKVSQARKASSSSKVATVSKSKKKSSTLLKAKNTRRSKKALVSSQPVQTNSMDDRFERNGEWIYDGQEYQRYVQEKRRTTPMRKPVKHYFMPPEYEEPEPDVYDQYGYQDDHLPPEPQPIRRKNRRPVGKRRYTTPEEIDQRFREIYEEYMSYDKGMTPSEAKKRAETAAFDEDDGEFVPPKDFMDKVEQRKQAIQDAKSGKGQKNRIVGVKNEYEIVTRKIVNPTLKDTFYSKMEDVQLGGMDLLVLRGNEGQPRAFTVVVDPDNYSGIDQVTTFYSANLAPVLVKMLRTAADQFDLVPGGERIGSLFRRDPLGKIGLTLTKSLDKAGEVIISNYTRPRTGDPVAFHAMLMNEAGLSRTEIIENTKIYKDMPVEFAGAFSDDPTVMLRTSVGVSPGKLEEYAVAVEGLFLRNDPLR